MKKEDVSSKTLLWLCLSIIFVLVGLAWGVSYFQSKEKTLVCTGKQSVIIKRKFYHLCFSKEKKQPNWVAQLLTKDALKLPQDKSAADYYPDFEIPKKDQASEEDYRNSGYVVGTFLFPFPDGVEENKEWKYQEIVFSATSPQNPEFHRGYWKKLRNRVRKLLFCFRKRYSCSTFWSTFYS